MGHKNFQHLRDKMSAESRAKSSEMAKEIMKEMLLSELRIQEGFSQRQLSAALGVKQP